MTFLRIGETQIKIRNAERLDTVRCRAFLFDLGVTNVKETTRTCGSARAHNPFDDGAEERLKRMGAAYRDGEHRDVGLDCAGPCFRRSAV